MKYFLTLGFVSSIFMFSYTNKQDLLSSKKLIMDKIKLFATALERRDVNLIDGLLHDEFRVVANQYPTAESLSVIPKDVYLTLLESGKIGGAKYEVNFDHVAIEDHSATVIVKFINSKSSMYLTLLLIESNKEWKIIEDMALIR